MSLHVTPVREGDRGGQRDDEGAEGRFNQCRAAGRCGMECCQRFVSVSGGAGLLKLVVPATVDDAGDAECAADVCMSVSGEEDLVAIPDGFDFRTDANTDLVGDCPDCFPSSRVRDRGK